MSKVFWEIQPAAQHDPSIKINRHKRNRNKKKEIPPPHRQEDFHALQISFLIGWFGSSTVSPRSSAFSATMISIIAAAGVIIFAFSIGPYR